MIKFTYEEENSEIEYTTREVSCTDIVEGFEKFLLGCGFHPNSIKNAFLELGEDDDSC